MPASFDELVTDLLILSAVAELRAADLGEGWEALQKLGSNVESAVIAALDGVLTDTEITDIADTANAVALAIVADETERVRV